MQLAEAARAEGNVFETIKYYLLSEEPEKALPFGIDFMKGKFPVSTIILIYLIFSFRLIVGLKINLNHLKF